MAMSRKCKPLLNRVYIQKALLTTSRTSALETAITFVNLKSSDEVVVPSYTFAASVNPIVMAGRNRFCRY